MREIEEKNRKKLKEKEKNPRMLLIRDKRMELQVESFHLVSSVFLNSLSVSFRR